METNLRTLGRMKRKLFYHFASRPKASSKPKMSLPCWARNPRRERSSTTWYERLALPSGRRPLPILPLNTTRELGETISSRWRRRW